MKYPIKALLATTAIVFAVASTSAQAETLRLLTWGGYAPDDVIAKFEEKYPDIDVEVTFSNNEEMIAKLRATGGAGFDLAQPSHDRIFAVQQEYDIYKPLDLSKIDTPSMEASLARRRQGQHHDRRRGLRRAAPMGHVRPDGRHDQGARRQELG